MTLYTLTAPGHPTAEIEADYALSAALAYGRDHALPDRSTIEVQREGWTEPRRVELALIYTARWVLTEEEREENRQRSAGEAQVELFGGAP